MVLLRELRQLATLMALRLRRDERSYTLVLGSTTTFASDIISAITDQNDLTQMFQALKRLSPDERYAVLSSAWTNRPLPVFYQYLATLIKRGYFDVILTTDPSNNLEAALINSGIPLSQFTVITFGQDNEASKRLESNTPKIKILKMRGDLISRSLRNVLPEESMQQLDPSIESTLRSFLDRDSVVVGLAPEDFDIERYIRASSGSLWMITPVAPAINSLMGTVAIARSSTKVIVGEMAYPVNFFSELLRLLSGTGSSNTAIVSNVIEETVAPLSSVLESVPENPQEISPDKPLIRQSNNTPIERPVIPEPKTSPLQEISLSKQAIRVTILVGGTIALFFGIILLQQLAPGVNGVQIVALLVIAGGIILTAMKILSPDHFVTIISYVLGKENSGQEETKENPEKQ